MRPISEKQKQILQFIQEYTASEGYPPAVREIAAAVGLRSPSSVHAHVKHLRELGYLEQCAGKTRTVKITARPERRLFPCSAVWPPGQPILAVEEQQAMLYIDLHGKSGSYFALHVRGDSMVNAAFSAVTRSSCASNPTPSKDRLSLLSSKRKRRASDWRNKTVTSG